MGSGESLRVLGIDPGLTRCGYAVVDDDRPRPTAVAVGVVSTAVEADLPERLARLRSEIVRLLDEYRPDVVAVERVFFQVNVRTAMAVGQASGIALSEAWSSGCEVVQYTPNEVKQTVAGHGSADKAQVGRMVMMRLGLNAVPKPADAADAAALALCHLAVAPTRRALQRARTSR